MFLELTLFFGHNGKPGPGTLVGPYKNRKNGTLVGLYKNRKTRTQDPSGTLEKLENRNPIIIIIIIFYYHHFFFCWLSHNHYNIM